MYARTSLLRHIGYCAFALITVLMLAIPAAAKTFKVDTLDNDCDDGTGNSDS